MDYLSHTIENVTPALRSRYFTVSGAPRIFVPMVRLAVGSDDGGDLAPGEFRATIAVFDTPSRPDFFGDTITFARGSFADVLKAADAMHPLPVIFTHMHDTVPLGPVLSAVETETGLDVHARLAITDNSARGDMSRAVHAAMLDHTLREFSFAALFDEESIEVRDRLDEDGEPIMHPLFGKTIDRLVHRVAEVFEVGPTLVGRHADTRLIEVQGAEAQAAQGQTTQALRGDDVRAAAERAGRLARLHR
jgi:hypothetical protein